MKAGISRQRIRPHSLAVLVAIALAAAPPPASAQYSVSWFTIDGGGTSFSSGGGFTLKGTIGQPDAGRMSGAAFTLSGGFWAGGQTVVGVGDEDEPRDVPLSFRLHGAAPNPVVDRTAVRFELPQSRHVRLSIHDAAGRQVRNLTDGRLPAGRHQAVWDGTHEDGRAVATGIYFLRLDASPDRAQQKVVVLR